MAVLVVLPACLVFFVQAFHVTYAQVLHVRLEGGDGRTTGRVEVSLNGSVYGTVCDDLWTEREAQVVCRMLKFQFGTAHLSAAFGEGLGDIFMDNVQCTGNEESLAQCQHNGWGVHNCRHYEDAGVSCFNNSVRLKSRGRTDVGTVEILSEADNEWLEVCDDQWDDEDARVLCKEMGFLDGLSQCCSTLGDVQSSTSPAKSFTNFKCIGTEPSLFNCSFKNNPVKCDPDHRASAICYNTSVSKVNTTFDVRLGDGTKTPYWGEVNVRYHGVWGQVCSGGTNWDDNAANVTCKQLGFRGGMAYGSVSETFMPVWITSLNCTGTETSLQNCVQGNWGRPVRSCKPAYALCFHQGVHVKLADGGDYYGRVEIHHDGHVGTICDTAWSSSDARVVCKYLGYADGDPVTGSYYGGGNGTIMMNGLGCYGYETSVLQCRNKGWMSYDNTECSSHKNDASVVCYKNVRLSRGDHSYGVVQIMEDTWSVLCGEGYTDIDARVVCRQLGFPNGTALTMGSFGTFYGRYVRPNISCTGQEKSIVDCTYDEFRGCQRDSFLGYAVVSCFNGTLNQDKIVKLDGGASGFENETGRVMVKQHGIWGRVCPNDWDDKDATVVCRKQGYAGGVAYKYTSTGSGPYTMGKVGCLGNETSLFDCPVSSELCDAQFSSGDAGVLCHRTRKAEIRLVGSHNSGRLEVIVDRTVGTICDVGWSRYDASVACRQLGFIDGEPRSQFSSLTGAPVVMYSMGCYGGESSLFMCRNPGWRKSIDDRCFEENKNAGVFCYNNVRVTGGNSNDNTTAGKVEVYFHGNWMTVCADYFDAMDARVVCRELGYPNYKALVPGAFGRKYFSDFLTSFNCTGTEATLVNCSFDSNSASCGDRSSNYASVLCSKYPVDEHSIRVVPVTSFPATVIVEKHGVNGTVCGNGWGNNEAMVVCRQLGYSGGVAFGPQYSLSSSPIWMTSVSCTGREMSLAACDYKETPTSECLSNHMAANVYCYQGLGFQLRLAGTGSLSFGRVEVAFNGIWGTICDSYWSVNDARVICRQLGFLDGVAQPNAFYGSGSGPSWLYYVRCDGNEKSVWSCTNSGFNVSHSSCRNHKYDASVYCTDSVRLEPNVTYGAVEIWNRERYQLVCADGFNDIDAKVTCKTLGYTNGVSVCCSAFGKMEYDIGYGHVRCNGNEVSILDCAMDSGADVCPSQTYAAVACSNAPASGEYELRLENENRGKVQVRHFDIWGHICPNGFDDNDAMVICRELGFLGGFSFYQSTYQTTVLELPWLSNINCSGSEGYLGRCGNIRWGEVPVCLTDREAAVYCYNNETYKFRLINGTSPLSGRIEMSIDGEWGTVCGLTNFDDKAANVLCRQMKFRGGRALPMGYFGPGTGNIFIHNIRCEGNESSILHCPIQIDPKNVVPLSFVQNPRLRYYSRQYSCWSHETDAAVQCYQSVRLVGSTELNYGRLEVERNNTWTAVCDKGFDDINAKFVCQQLGYLDGKKQCCSALGPLTPNDNVKITITNLDCNGGKSTINECTQKGGTCESGQYVSVYCNESIITENAIKVQITENKYYGSLEANLYGFWGPICPLGWDDNDARVACKQMGYEGGVAFNGSTRLHSPYAVGNFSCNGLERSLRDCPYKDFSGDQGCQYSIQGTYTRPTAGVLCYRDKGGVKFRIVGAKTRGVVQIMFDGEWGRVCNNSWKDVDAGVFCRQQGFIDGVAYDANSERKTGTTVWLNYIDCSGHEKSILECTSTWNPGSSNCDDAAVICYDSVRLTSGDNLSHGAVQVNMNGNWGAVCNHQWDLKDVMVTCRQLGFQKGLPLCCAPYGYTTSMGFMDNMNCSGQETKLMECSHGPPYGQSCMMDYASVVCYNGEIPTSYTLALSGANNSTGAVEVQFLNITGRICADNWDDVDATVICKEMGFSRGEAYTHYKWSTGRGENAPFWTSRLNCTAKDRNLGSCEKVPFGYVDGCVSRHYAGALCYYDHGLSFRLGGGSDNHGRVEVAVDGHWGSICNRYWDINDASVFCKYLGYATGFPSYAKDFNKGTGPVYEPNLHCNGSESSLKDCPLEGWRKITGSHVCADHEMDAAVYCYNSVKLGTGVGKSVNHGSVQYYNKEKRVWEAICANNFDDNSAKVVCRELGFMTGKSICCSAYGKTYEDILVNMTMQCTGQEKLVNECLKPGVCNNTDFYASVMCFNESEFLHGISEDYRFSIQGSESGNYSGQIVVSHYGVEGRICSEAWDDNDAMVFCKQRGYGSGLAYHHADNEFAPLSGRGPYWMSNVDCRGSEPSINNCTFGDRLSLGNCNQKSSAAVLCYNDNGIKYRFANGSKNYGRVEMSVNDVWGTICDASWDDADATVLCRQEGFSGGYALKEAYYGHGSGPVWLSHLQCNGSETKLQQCLHRGFSSQIVDGSSGWWNCRSHRDDAGVYCINNLRLSQGFNASMGAVQIYDGHQWLAVCDDSFDKRHAQVVCRTLGFQDGTIISGSAFGNLSSPIGINHITCNGDEKDFSQCVNKHHTKECRKGTYASVFCSKESISNEGFKVRLHPDSDRTDVDYHGHVEVQLHGVWGSVCSSGWDIGAADVTCRQLGFLGGMPYRPPNNFSKPIMISGVRCNGREETLEKCEFHQWNVSKDCSFYEDRAGVFCYKSPMQFRLAGDPVAHRGRVEIKINKVWGGICDWLWDSRDARVWCKSLDRNYEDGLEIVGARYGHVNGPLWFTRVSCKGHESNVLLCQHTGFNSSDAMEGVYAGLCRTRSHDASVECFEKKLSITQIQLVDGFNNQSGRVEVFLAGPDQWGTVCDDYWDDIDATVVCNQMGFATGKAVKGATFGRGTGPIWLDNLGCYGNESRLQDCDHNGFSVQNCNHGEDAGVICSGTYTGPSSPGVVPTHVPGQQTSSPGVVPTNVPEQLQGHENIVIAVTVPIIVLLITAFAVVVFLFWRKMRPKGEIKKVLVHNDMNDPSTTSSAAMSTDGRVTLSKLKAHFSKSKSIQNGKENEDSSTISNPVYENFGKPVLDEMRIEQPGTSPDMEL